MDIINETSKESKILAARHISADKTFPEANNAVNSTLLCHTYSLQPDFLTYFTGLQSYAYVIWLFGGIALLATCIIFAVSIRLALRHWREYIVHVVVILLVYPIVTAASFVTLLVPRSRLVCEAVAQEAVMLAMYHLYCLIIAECSGADQLVRRAGGSRLETRVPPCCCWPCCVIPQPHLQKKTFTWLKALILQMPIVQAIIYFFILVLWSEDIMVYLKCFSYIQPVVAISILSGVWGMIMCVRAAEVAGAQPRKRFVVVQVTLIIVKLQNGLAKVLPELVNLPCILDLNPSVVVNMIQNCIMISEMLLLSMLACCLYRTPPGKIRTNPQVAVAVLDDSDCSAVDVKSIKDTSVDPINTTEVKR